MADELESIEEEPQEVTAIQKILRLINELDQFEEDLSTKIKAEGVVSADPDEICMLVEAIAHLVEVAIKQNEDGEEFSEPSENAGSGLSNKKNEVENTPKVKPEKNPQRAKRSLSDDNQMNRSAQGIRHEFQKSEEESSQFEELIEYKMKNEQNYPEMVQSIQDHNYEYNLLESGKKKVMPFTYDHNQHDDSPEYLEQKMSETKMGKKKKIFNQTGTKMLKKNPEKNQLIYGQRRPKKLVVHPKTPQTLKKAKSQEEILLTRKTQQ